MRLGGTHRSGQPKGTPPCSQDLAKSTAASNNHDSDYRMKVHAPGVAIGRHKKQGLHNSLQVTRGESLQCRKLQMMLSKTASSHKGWRGNNNLPKRSTNNTVKTSCKVLLRREIMLSLQ